MISVNCQTSLTSSYCKNNGELFPLLCLKAEGNVLEFLFIHLPSHKSGYIFALLHYYSL